MYKSFLRKKDVAIQLASLQSDETCLSHRVYHILCEAGLEADDSRTAQVLETNGIISWSKLEKLMPEYLEDTYEYFAACAATLAPVFQSTEAFMKKLSEEEFKKIFSEWFSWTSSPKVLERCFLIIKEERSTSSNLALLLMLPILERSLGDVFLMKGKQCPSMIKDLLVTEELEEVFGQCIIQLLRIVLGPPISLNLRNVTWHGFPQPNELPPRYGYFMLHVIASLGYVLHKQGITPSQIPHRPFVAFPQVHDLTGIFPEIGEEQCGLIEELILESSFVLPQMQPLWKRALESYREARYGDSVVVLLPQLEHGLRRLFALANNCPERVLTAENTVLFTTFDEILASKLDQNTPNMLCELIGSTHVTLLMDMLLYPEGPRLRDRFSHGETSFEPVEGGHHQELEAIANHVISVSVCLCMFCIPEDSHLQKVDYLNKVQTVGQNYTSVFHPIALLNTQLKKLCCILTKFQTIPRPTEEDIGTTVQWQHVCSISEYQSSDIYKASESMVLAFGNVIPPDALCMLQPFHNLEEFSQKYVDIGIVTLYRSSRHNRTDHVPHCTSSTVVSKEDEVIGLLRKIASECLKACSQIQVAVGGKYQEWLEKKLRSRQRDTYRRMLDLFPSVSSGLRQVLLILVLHLHALAQDNQHLLTRHVKFLKTVLQYSENWVSFTSPDKNRWEEAHKYTQELIRKCSSI